ncbi:hypothetical protein MHK_001842, partial [Candidatus Magnetomorum sp. HK-1]
MCRACYRGHVYCSTKCRIAGYLQKHREAQKRYRGKEKGRLKHRELEKERRNKFKGKGNKITEKIYGRKCRLASFLPSLTHF